jgi:hypothetical protein
MKDLEVNKDRISVVFKDLIIELASAIDAEPCTFPVPTELEFFDYNVVRAHIKDIYYVEPSELSRRKSEMKALKV